MEDAILLKKLIDTGNESFKLYQMYQMSITGYQENDAGLFKQISAAINDLLKFQYDYNVSLKWIATSLNITKRDAARLCDMLCFMLGEKLKEICAKPLFCTPTHIDEYCPISTDELVMYTDKPFDVELNSVVIYDKTSYRTLNCIVEKSPYYEIYVTKLELL